MPSLSDREYTARSESLRTDYKVWGVRFCAYLNAACAMGYTLRGTLPPISFGGSLAKRWDGAYWPPMLQRLAEGAELAPYLDRFADLAETDPARFGALLASSRQEDPRLTPQEIRETTRGALVKLDERFTVADLPRIRRFAAFLRDGGELTLLPARHGHALNLEWTHRGGPDLTPGATPMTGAFGVRQPAT